MIEESDWWSRVGTAFLVGMPTLVGLALLVGAARQWARVRALLVSGRPATARVVDNQLESLSDGRTSFRPVVTFRTETGQEVTTTLPDLDGSRSHLVGTEVAVRYDPEKPSDATPAKASSAQTVVAVVFGVIFLVFALVAYQVMSSGMEDAGQFSDFP
ncbi:hypothetical protein AMIS_59720 [Actinoplanes missouriensis 431]|uniref:DUF3592 domain-containing protein n=1 Tax=Actinoplanes missouriensis (strain ATCC 14538 / DSM 43046 / CBS 188.64 / JCM 3121 / NBRC 102363 / NCIMB 12654 / NRRL B-3342 / UNCC 431) TaxID=512565 RepID=I0HDV5_ACTM4|nr:DUF3592 domain-containing protein [Actinoplanes missouriensis]BAL91192.1 hypothetical protein AMIS_59720 [Actinoplanes missouriensis 431]